MKRLIFKTSFFAILLAIILFLINTISLKTILKNANFNVDKKTKILILGHSHAAYAYNDSIIKNAVNLAEGGESYFYTFQKTKEIIADNPQIKTILIEFSNDNLDTSMNSWVYNEPYMSNRYPKYAPFMNMNDNLILILNNPASYTNSYLLSYQYNLKKNLEKRYNFAPIIGGYTHSEKKKLKKQKDQSSYEIDKSDLPWININYLKKIIQFSQSNGVKCYLIRTPTCKESLFNQNETLYQEILKNEFLDIEFLDFKNFPISDECFIDNEHLNSKGALIYSKFFNYMLNRNVLNIRDKQQFIDSMIFEYDKKVFEIDSTDNLK